MLAAAFNDYTVVLGVDDGHLEHFQHVIPNWKKYKPSLFNQPWLIFYDAYGKINSSKIYEILEQADAMPSRICLIHWPTDGVTAYETVDGIGRFGNSQRYKMLAGFVHVPARYVATNYWLKLDLDAVATGEDQWIDPSWFEDHPAIVAHPWGYTKPANQMSLLDAWVQENAVDLPPRIAMTLPLNLHYTEGASAVSHSRVISWCGFFRSSFTRECSKWAEDTCGTGKLPVPSQDGFMWYSAERMRLPIVRARMKHLVWKHCSILQVVKEWVEGLNA